MKKVLFIACLYPPAANSGTQRSAKFTKHLPAYGWEPIVLTTEVDDASVDPTLLQELRADTRIERIPFYHEVIAKKIAKVLTPFMSEERVKNAISWRLRELWRVPDLWASWRPMAVKRGLELYESEKFDCIYVSGFPWSSFLVARDISLKTGVPYVLDFRDLWTSWNPDWHISSRIARWMAKRLEAKVMKNAAAVIATSDTQVDVLRGLSPSASHQLMQCITNGFDPEDFLVEPAPPREQPTKIRLVYAGVWKQGYSPVELYDALVFIHEESPEWLAKFELLCAGFPPGIYQNDCLNGIVKELGRLSHKDALALMASADILFLPVAEGSYSLGHIPGKLFEYLASHKPIIAAAPNGSEVRKILEHIECGKCVEPKNTAALASALVEMAHSGGFASSSYDASKIKEFERSELTKKLSDVLLSVI